MAKRTLNVFERHQLKVARDTLKMTDAGAKVMGGPTKAEARQIIKRLTGKMPVENPSGRESMAKRNLSKVKAKRLQSLIGKLKTGKFRLVHGYKIVKRKQA